MLTSVYCLMRNTGLVFGVFAFSFCVAVEARVAPVEFLGTVEQKALGIELSITGSQYGDQFNVRFDLVRSGALAKLTSVCFALREQNEWSILVPVECVRAERTDGVEHQYPVHDILIKGLEKLNNSYIVLRLGQQISDPVYAISLRERLRSDGPESDRIRGSGKDQGNILGGESKTPLEPQQPAGTGNVGVGVRSRLRQSSP
jgi:hypothetical protein